MAQESSIIGSNNYNRPICRFFVLGRCRYGLECHFSHTLPEGGITEARSLIPCPYYPRCKYGDRCHFRHDDVVDVVNDNNNDDANISSNNESKDSSSSSSFTTSEEARSSSFECGICFEDPSASGKRFGLLLGCSHCYCLDCMRQWRKSNGGKFEVTHSCPQCRVKSDFIVPSATFSVGEEKEVVIRRYKENLGKIKCKKFDGTIGSCPFGKECFYAHRGANGEDLKPMDRERKKWRRRNNRRRTRGEANIEFHDLMSDLDAFIIFLNMYGLIVEDGSSDEEDNHDSSVEVEEEYGWEIEF